MTIGLLTLVVIIAITARHAAALKPDQVLIVANANSPASVELASFYATQRGIVKRNIVLIKTSEKYTISRQDYQTTIRGPIVQSLLERRLDGHIRSICLVWGVPVRIAEDSKKANPPASNLSAFYKAQSDDAIMRLTVCYKLLARIGQAPDNLPDPPNDRMEKFETLFVKPLPTQAVKAPKLDELILRLRKEVVRRQVKVRFTADKKVRVIAERQLMALYREMYGLKGLIGYVRDTKIINPPDIKLLMAAHEQAENALARLGRPNTPLTLANARGRIKLLKLVGGLRLVAGYKPKGLPVSRTKLTSRQQRARRMFLKTTASVDSELALLWAKTYKTEGAISNPLYRPRRVRSTAKGRPGAVMVARIDGPTVAIARKIVTDSLAVEKTGLKGVFYIDSGLPQRFVKSGASSGYRIYDKRLQVLNAFVSKKTNVKTVMDTSSKLFAPDTCPDAALYAGWYSLRKYVPAFKWRRGAVGWHTASFEAADLRNPKSQQWCPQMLLNGAAATLGAVDEPFLTAFPAPEEFYPLLLTGKYTIAECYWRTMPQVSWQMVLIADPLYNPFKTNPQLASSLLPGGLAL
jgi:uncharacterized protein (TIGR03790 family)